MPQVRLFTLLLCVVIAGCHSSPPVVKDAPRFELVVLGIAQDGGLPHLGCVKECCTQARITGKQLYPASLGIHDTQTGALVLVEVTPQVEAQVARLHRTTGVDLSARARKPVDALLITHAHIGHYSGLIHFGREVASTSKVPLHVSKRMSAFLRENGPWSQLVDLEQVELKPFRFRNPFEPIPGLRVTAIPVPHRDEYSDTVAFKFQGSEYTVLFVPDIDKWDRDLLAELMEDVDYAYLDATFYDGSELPGRDLSEIPHPPMVQTMERLEAIARARPGAMRFIHLNHTNPALHSTSIQKKIQDNGFQIAKPGERLRF